MTVIRREKELVDMKKVVDELLYRKGVKNFRYFKKGKGLINALKLTEFRSYIEFDKPLLYIRFQDVPFALQSNRIVVEAENETKANELIDIFISKYIK